MDRRDFRKHYAEQIVRNVKAHGGDDVWSSVLTALMTLQGLDAQYEDLDIVHNHIVNLLETE